MVVSHITVAIVIELNYLYTVLSVFSGHCKPQPAGPDVV